MTNTTSEKPILIKNKVSQTPMAREKFSHKAQRDPFLDWIIILAISLVLTIILVAVGVSVYLDTGTRLTAPSSVGSGNTKILINTSTLNSVIEGFDSRATEHSALIKSSSFSKDPSLP